MRYTHPGHVVQFWADLIKSIDMNGNLRCAGQSLFGWRLRSSFFCRDSHTTLLSSLWWRPVGR
jgi:hypothetical protein